MASSTLAHCVHVFTLVRIHLRFWNILDLNDRSLANDGWLQVALRLVAISSLTFCELVHRMNNQGQVTALRINIDQSNS